ncbi:RCC1 domain-containing protein [Longimicrobium terrae]|uniref:Alpha-tubulin suppressor-like RCC1 family protein n=1 Tax=Longimicrobium terrae TaxID=1639882 RepID=A0A841H3F3_9BACT|nr:hypothetical protein [Longimicrobium terrae]MBB4638074.1 alpha-tubulin suppressor-like RCC1 family protein [Longimicrobium terrae]MBB6072446.1 alpha-tubulin suppressor-like RCC1 family protein [Longimicrobium terrae]NNC32140.1 hypothetical protein [Longimicrobium terrae]
MKSIRRLSALVLAGVPLAALSACGDLLTDEAPGARRVLVQLNEAEFGRTFHVAQPLRLELFASDQGGLGVGSVEVRWAAGEASGTVQPDRERTNGNGFLEATWTPGNVAGRQRIYVEVMGTGMADTLEVDVAPDTVVGSVDLRADADTMVAGETQRVSLERVADRFGNAYNLTGGGLPAVSFSTPDTAVLDVSPSGLAAVVTARAAGVGRVIARVGSRADTVAITVRRFIAPGSFRVVRAGAYYSCGTTLPGAAHCWGDNAAGQLGTGGAEPSLSIPAALRALAGVAVEDLALGEIHTCAVAAGGVWCWGDNSVGQLGDGTQDPRPEPVRVAAPAGVRFTSVGVGIVHTCALAEDGGVWCWGDNSAGQLGAEAGPGDPSPQPVRVAAPGAVFSSLSVGAVHACALTAEGAAWCWGDNSTGQLGTGTVDAVAGAVAVESAGAPFTQLGAGFLHTCAVRASGTTACWGDNSYGQLGNGSTEMSASPVAVSGPGRFRQVSGGLYHTCAVTAEDGRAFCWGANGSGRLGSGDEADSPVPVEVRSGEIRFQSVDAGYEHSCALGTDNEGYCWGRNSAGELGTGFTSGASLQPVRVSSPVAPALRRAAAAHAAPTRARSAARAHPRPAVCGRIAGRTRGRLPSCR